MVIYKVNKEPTDMIKKFSLFLILKYNNGDESNNIVATAIMYFRFIYITCLIRLLFIKCICNIADNIIN